MKKSRSQASISFLFEDSPTPVSIQEQASISFLFGGPPLPTFAAPPRQRNKSKASLSVLFGDVAALARPIPPARHKHPPASIIKGRIRTPNPTYDIRSIPVADRASLPPPSNEELVARYHSWLTTVASRFQTTYGASIEDRDDAIQDGMLKLLKVQPDKRNHDKYCKVVLTNQLKTSFDRYRRVFDPLMPIDPEWDTQTPDEADHGLIARLEAKDDAVLDDMMSTEFVTQALSSLSVEHRLVMSLFLGLGEDSRPIENLRALSQRSYVAVAKLPAMIRSATAKLQRWHANRSQS